MTTRTYTRKAIVPDAFEDGNFYSESPYEVEEYIGEADKQAVGFADIGLLNYAKAWRESATRARKWLAEHFDSNSTLPLF